MLDIVHRLIRDRRASVPVEYAIIAVVLGVALIASIGAMATVINNLKTVSNAMG